MNFFLTSNSIVEEEVFGYLEDFLGKSLKGFKVAYITTPADVEIDNAWIYEALEVLHKSPLDIAKLDIKDKTKDELRPILDNHDAIWIGGGFAGYFLEIVYRIGFDELLQEYLESGKLYLGSSIGTMILKLPNLKDLD